MIKKKKKKNFHNQTKKKNAIIIAYCCDNSFSLKPRSITIRFREYIYAAVVGSWSLSKRINVLHTTHNRKNLIRFSGDGAFKLCDYISGFRRTRMFAKLLTNERYIFTLSVFHILYNLLKFIKKKKNHIK